MFIVEESKSKPKKENSLWVEKYRPSNLDGYIGNEVVRESISRMIKSQDIPHLLFFGDAGTGKTTLAKLIVNNIKCDYIYINASADNGIDTVREKLKNFAMGAGWEELKVVILDEADYLSTAAQAGLRNMMESYSMHTRFIMTCNYAEKMIPAIISRCQTFEIRPISKKDIAMNLVKILKNENVTFTTDDIGFCVNTFYPDIRKVINFAQQSTVDGSFKICKENAIDDELNQLVELLKTPNKVGIKNEIRQLVSGFDPNNLDVVYKYLFDKVDIFAKGKESLAIIEIAEAVNNSVLVIPAVRDITFLACIYKLIESLK